MLSFQASVDIKVFHTLYGVSSDTEAHGYSSQRLVMWTLFLCNDVTMSAQPNSGDTELKSWY